MNALMMKHSVYYEIEQTIGMDIPERGGVLGAGSDGCVIAYYFDQTGRSEPDAYVPDTEAINKVLSKWHERGIHIVGIVHSHKSGLPFPSCGDIGYGMQILGALDTTDRLYLPIVTRGESGMMMRAFVIDGRGKDRGKCREIRIELVN